MSVDKSNKFLWGWSLLLIISAFFTVLFFWHHWHQKTPLLSVKIQKVSSERREMSEMLKFLDEKDIYSVKNLPDVLFADTVLSILKNYYVDLEKVNPDSLYRSLVKNLKKQLDVDVQEKEGHLNISYKGKKASFSPKKNVKSFDAFLDKILNIGFFVNSQLEFSQENGRNGFSKVLELVVDSLDPHTVLLSAEDYQELKEETEGVFGGVGIVVGVRNYMLTVLNAIPGSPAEKAGVSSLDKILSINGTPTFGASIVDLIKIMKGKPGTTIRLKLLSSHDDSPHEVILKREMITVNSVEEHLVKGEEGEYLHLKIDSFSQRTDAEIESSLKRYFKKHRSIRGAILDLRGNPGGLLEQAIKVSDLFLDDGKIVITRGNELNEIVSSTTGKIDVPLIVLVDEGSASASEIVTGALKYNGRSVTVGQTSYGKGSVQTVFELPFKRALKVTIAKYFSPNDRTIDGIGITPDIMLHEVLANSEKADNGKIFSEENYRSLTHKNYSQQLTQKDKEKSLFSSYFISGKAGGKTSEEGSKKSLEVATFLLDKFNDKKSPIKNKSDAKKFLELSQPLIANYLQSMDEKVLAYFKQEKNTDWSFSEKEKFSEKDLEMSEVKALSLGHGIFDIKYKLKNTTDKILKRISTFVLNEEEGNVAEFVHGSMEAKEVREGSLRIRTSSKLKGSLDLLVGFARDLNIVENKLIHLTVQTDAAIEPVLQANVSLVDESGGAINGHLEPKEVGKVQVTVTNTGNRAVQGVDAQLLNLTGLQIDVSKENLHIKEILPGRSEKISFLITGAKKLLTKTISLGLVLDGFDFHTPFEKNITITALPSNP